MEPNCVHLSASFLTFLGGAARWKPSGVALIITYLPLIEESVFIWSPNEFLISLLLTRRYQGHKWRKQPIPWLCSPWWTSAGPSAERPMTNDDAIVLRHINIAISACHLLPGGVLLWVRCNMSLLIHASSFNLWEQCFYLSVALGGRRHAGCRDDFIFRT